MRILFNHGLRISELYSNTPKKIIDRKWRWFIKNYGSSSSYEDAIADPMKYILVLIFNKMLDDKVRFRLPVKMEAYWDFEIVLEEDFTKQRQLGRFQNIDFIESDFTGYAMRYFFRAKAYQKSYPIYLGGDLKKKFLNKINSGEKFYTTKDITINDLLPDVYAKFPELTKKEVKNLISHGFRRMHSAMKYGCALTLNTVKYGNCYAYIGQLSLKPDWQIKEYNIRRDRKLRKIEGWKKTPFDGYYYIGLNPKGLEDWLELNKTSRSIVKFKNVIPRKIMKELFYKYREVYIFRIKLKKFKGWSHWAESINSRDTTYMGKVNNLEFKPSNLTWRELRNEKRSS